MMRNLHPDPQISGTGTSDRMEVGNREMTGGAECGLEDNDEEGNVVYHPPQMPTTGAVPKKSYNRKNIFHHCQYQARMQDVLQGQRISFFSHYIYDKWHDKKPY